MRALICGVGGQDGAFLSKLLLEKGYEVIGTSRDATTNTFSSLRQLGILKDVHTASMVLNDFRSVLTTIKYYSPDEVYNLAGQTSVALSFEQPVETIESIATGTLYLLEAIRFVDNSIRFYNAGSSECFGDTGHIPANELTKFKPRSPYAIAKSSAFWMVANYREAYGLFACTGILFNHESIIRPVRFVTQKIVHTASRISKGSTEKLKLGNVNIQRDWGWSEDYTRAMWLMVTANVPDDYVIATGRTVSLEYFISKVFEEYGLDWRQHVVIDDKLFRPTEIITGRADPSKARIQLDWHHTVDVDGVISRMCNAVKSGSENL